MQKYFFRFFILSKGLGKGTYVQKYGVYKNTIRKHLLHKSKRDVKYIVNSTINGPSVNMST